MPANALPLIKRLARAAFVFAGLFTVGSAPAQTDPTKPITRPARRLNYSPDAGDFVTVNGSLRFNRPLYCGNSGVRVEVGDRPELAFWLPGRAGTLRLGLQLDGQRARWLNEFDRVVARYRPGSMVYEITDPALGATPIQLVAVPLAEGDGVIIRAILGANMPNGRLIWAFGGSDGHPGRRNGDLNAEREPLSKYFDLKPELCRGLDYRVQGSGFEITNKAGTVLAVSSGRDPVTLADGLKWANASDLLASRNGKTEAPVVVGELALQAGQPSFIVLRKKPAARNVAIEEENFASIFVRAEARRQALVDRLRIDTPDAHLNAAAGAIAVAGDAIWDEPTSAFMHGAVGWRVKLLGWRGAYAGDVLGFHDRTRRHLDTFAADQNTADVPTGITPADEAFNLSRNESSLHTNGYFAGKDTLGHYDMNLVAIDTLFRHLLWTGDLEYARKMWPVIERHLAWERRLFRRPFGSDGLPLYEAYACIWASDELIYGGGGATHATAYNYWHHRMAASLARALGRDGTPYDAEATLIAKGMNRELWLPQSGWFGESKDLLGRQTVHPSPAVWTFYHTLDSQAATAMQAWQMSRFIEKQSPRLPLRAPGVPDGAFNIATTDWMPYTWSINNVALAESAHTAMGLWQAERGDLAMAVLRGALLDAMFMGSCPGNVGMTSLSDAYSNERYRDFADAVGISSRTIVEGLFGIRPDLLTGTLTLHPGFPREWDHAKLHLSELDVTFERKALLDTYVVESRLAKPVRLRLELPALRDRVTSLTVNGRPTEVVPLPDAVGTPRILVTVPASARAEIRIEWGGAVPEVATPSRIVSTGEALPVNFSAAKLVELADPQSVLSSADSSGGPVTQKVVGAAGHRTLFAKLQQGELRWWQPIHVEVRPPFEAIAAADQNPSSLRFDLRNNCETAFKGKATFRVGGINETRELEFLPRGGSQSIEISATGLSPGTHSVSITMGGDPPIECRVTNWNLSGLAGTAVWETVDIRPFFNDRISQIFKNEYRSPRSPYCSLAMPKQGIGGWCLYKTTAEIDDTGLRATAAKTNGRIETPLGIPFQTAVGAQEKNVVFTSLWDNYPDDVTIPVAGRAARVCLLMAGSTNPMQCRIDNGEVIITYEDGSTDRLALRNPENWWPIEQDLYVDGLAFARVGQAPPRLDLKTGAVRLPDGSPSARKPAPIAGGSASVLDLPLDRGKALRSITVRSLANDVVIGLVSVTLER